MADPVVMATRLRASFAPDPTPPTPPGVWLNDHHSLLNRTRVGQVTQPGSLEALRTALAEAADRNSPVAICGNRYSMGGQQFRSDGTLIDMRCLNRVISFDPASGLIDVEAGITWTELQAALDHTRPGHGHGAFGWGIAQKQTGADALTIGGAVASNVHGRGLTKAPFIEDIESLTLLDASGQLLTCSRSENTELFRHVVGGYGMFGIVHSVRIRLVPRERMRRVVEIIDADSLMTRFDERIAAGFRFGDFQFHIDHECDDFLRRGVFSCYLPVPEDTPAPDHPPVLGRDDWLDLLHLAHADKSRGFQLYSDHYLRTDGGIYWSDTLQFTTYINGYHQTVDRRLGSSCPGSEMITEIYVPRSGLPAFLAAAADDLRRCKASVIYGTVRLIERDDETNLAWAREPWACVIFNICVEHSGAGLRDARHTFRTLIDRGIAFGGSYYLTYHKFARRDQVEACHPRLAEVLRTKRSLDPGLRFQSDWWLHHDRLLIT